MIIKVNCQDKSGCKPRCPICGSDKCFRDGVPKASPATLPLIRRQYQVFKCHVCKFCFIFPKIDFSKDEWANLYADGYFEPSMTKWWSKKRTLDRKQRLDWLEQAVSPNKIRDFLDIGCGQGFVLIDALTRGWRVQGVDIQDNRIALARNDAIHFAKGDLLEIGFPNDSFDCIYMDSVLEHVMDPMMYLREIRKILRPKGALYIGVPNEENLVNDVKKMYYRLFGKDISTRLKPFVSPYHVNGFTKTSLKKVLNDSGFSIAIFRNFAGYYNWLKYRALSKPFLIEFTLLPIHLAAIFLRKQVYLETVVIKCND